MDLVFENNVCIIVLPIWNWNPNFAIIYDASEKEVRIADLLFNTKIDNDKQQIDIEKSEIQSIRVKVRNTTNLMPTVFAEIRDSDFNLVKEDYVSVAYRLIDFYKTRQFVPKEIWIDFPLQNEDCELLTDFLKNEMGKSTSVIIPKIGDKKRIVSQASTNAKENVSP